MGATGFAAAGRNALAVLRQAPFIQLTVLEGWSVHGVASKFQQHIWHLLSSPPAGSRVAREGSEQIFRLSELLRDASAVGMPELFAAAFFAQRRELRIPSARFHGDLGSWRGAVVSSILQRSDNGNGTLRIAEIGVFDAGTSELLLQAHPGLHWLGVDPFELVATAEGGEKQKRRALARL